MQEKNVIQGIHISQLGEDLTFDKPIVISSTGSLGQFLEDLESSIKDHLKIEVANLLLKDKLIEEEVSLSTPFQIWHLSMHLKFFYDIPLIYYGCNLHPTEENVRD